MDSAVLLIDFETTGLDNKQDRIIELGFQITDESFNTPKDGGNALLWDPSYPDLTDEISGITGITQEEMDRLAVKPEVAFAELGITAAKYPIKYVIAYNKEFDEGFFRREVDRGHFGLLEGIGPLCQVPWLCAMKDVESNYKMKCWKLSHIALDYMIPVDPRILHRASDDVELMRQMLVATTLTPEKMFEFQQEPTAVLACDTGDFMGGEKRREDAKRLGYSWEKARGDDRTFKKQWVKKVKTRYVDEEIKRCPLRVTVIA